MHRLIVFLVIVLLYCCFCCVRFIVPKLVHQRIGYQERLRNDPLCVESDAKTLTRSRPSLHVCHQLLSLVSRHLKPINIIQLDMWANAQCDGRRPAEYRWRPLFNAAVWLTATIRVPCSNTAKTRKRLKSPGVPQTNETISAASGPKFTILSGHVGEILLLKIFFPIVDKCLSCKDIARQSCGMVLRWRFLATLLGPAFAASRMQHISYLHSKFALGPRHV